MTFFRQYIIPVIVLLGFLVALVAVSARIFLPSDMAEPAPIEEVESAANTIPETGTTKAIPEVKAPTLPTSTGVMPKVTGVEK